MSILYIYIYIPTHPSTHPPPLYTHTIKVRILSHSDLICNITYYLYIISIEEFISCFKYCFCYH